MKSLIRRFVADQSGALSFEDGLTTFSWTLGFIGALALMSVTIVQLYPIIAGMFPAIR